MILRSHEFAWHHRYAVAHHCRDEILNGKTLDKNSNYFARYCFENGIDLYVALMIYLQPFKRLSCSKKIEVIPDVEEDM